MTDIAVHPIVVSNPIRLQQVSTTHLSIDTRGMAIGTCSVRSKVLDAGGDHAGSLVWLAAGGGQDLPFAALCEAVDLLCNRAMPPLVDIVEDGVGGGCPVD